MLVQFRLLRIHPRLKKEKSDIQSHDKMNLKIMSIDQVVLLFNQDDKSISFHHIE